MLPELLNQCRTNKNSCNSYLMTHIGQFILLFEQLEKTAGQDFTSLFKPFSYQKGVFLLREGEISSRIWILEEGIARLYSCHKGEEITGGFFFPGEFIDSYSSSTFREVSNVNIQLLTNARGWYIAWDEMEKLKNNYRVVSEIEKKIVVCYLLNIEMREQRLRCLSAPQHYQFLLDHYPNYIQYLPVTFIASYLGISLGSLSRIRREVQLFNVRKKIAY
jgi:CRP-like cAMP-binding protein